MIKCLNCENEIKDKSPTAKFCSGKCRVAYHRKHSQNRPITPVQMQVLYNAVLETLAKAGEPIPQSVPLGTFYEPNKEQKNGSKTFQQLMNELPDLMYEEEYKRWAKEVESSELVTNKQKDLLLQNMRNSKM